MIEKTIRKQVRYERNDINAAFKKAPLFFNAIQPAKILNISKQGMAICSSQVLKRNNRLKITLCFNEGERFFLHGLVVHSFNKPNTSDDEFVELFLEGAASPIALPFKYGIHFEYHNLQFRDYLIESGCRNGFEVRQRGFYQRQARAD